MNRMPNWLLVIFGAVLLYPALTAGGWIDAYIGQLAIPVVIAAVLTAIVYSGRSGAPEKRP